jgi:cytochrome oxidase assembly protein ShyY1
VRFLLSRRWALFALGVVVLAYACVLLGQWQFRRLHDTEQRNEWARVNMASDPAPVQDVLAVGTPLPERREWTHVRAVGHYDEGKTVTVRYQTRNGASGVDVVTPLVTADGKAVLVDRGWVPTTNTGATPAHLPTPPPGQVEVVGWARADATGDSTQVDNHSTRAIASTAIAPSLGYPVYAGFVDAQTENPAPTATVVRPEKPDLGNGPHLFYGIQWWFFGALALVGFGYLAWDEWRKRGSDDESDEALTVP